LAIEAVADTPRKLVARALRTFGVYDFRVDAARLPKERMPQIPSELEGKFYLDVQDSGEDQAAPSTLHFIGPMTLAERERLLGLVTRKTPWLAEEDLDKPHLSKKLNDHFSELLVPPVEVPRKFTKLIELATTTLGRTLGDVGHLLFGESHTPEHRFNLVLERLLPHLERTLSERFVVSRVGEQFQIETRAARRLLDTRLPQVNTDETAAPGEISCMEVLRSRGFVDIHPRIPVKRTGFLAPFHAYVRLDKAARIAQRFGQTDRQLGWFAAFGAQVGWLDFNQIPTVAGNEKPFLFDGWERLYELVELRDSLPGGERTLDTLFALTRGSGLRSAWIEELAERTGWSEAVLTKLLGSNDQANTEGACCTFDSRPTSRVTACFAACSNCSEWTNASVYLLKKPNGSRKSGRQRIPTISSTLPQPCDSRPAPSMVRLSGTRSRNRCEMLCARSSVRPLWLGCWPITTPFPPPSTTATTSTPIS
jgi:hypothetical protein